MTERAQGAIIGGRYRLDQLLGAGGMGEVWTAVNTVTGRRLALKFLKPQYASKPELRARFLREARAASAVSHPNIVTVFDVLESESDTPAIAMELLDGEPLSARLERRGALPLAEVARLMVPALGALHAAHERGIVHRDLKPDNIFVVRLPDGSEQTKVLDFGIAKVEVDQDGVGALTKTGAVMGTPYYMSPEQAFGEKAIDRRTDVWSLGIILYQALTGALPTAADNWGQIVKIITSEGITPIHQKVTGLPSAVTDLVMQMLARHAAQRPASLEQVAKVLAAYTGSEVPTQYVVSVAGNVPSSGTGQALTVSDVGEPAAVATGAVTDGTGRARRRVLALMGGGVAMLAAVGGGLALRASSGRHQATPSPVESPKSAVAPQPPPLTPAAVDTITPLESVARPLPPPSRLSTKLVPDLDASVAREIKRPVPAPPRASSAPSASAAPPKLPRLVQEPPI